MLPACMPASAACRALRSLLFIPSRALARSARPLRDRAVLRKIDGASQDRASARVCLALARMAKPAVHLEPEPGRAAVDRSRVWPVARRKPDIDDGFKVSKNILHRDNQDAFKDCGNTRRSAGFRAICAGRQQQPEFASWAGRASRTAAGRLCAAGRGHEPSRQTIYGRGKGLVRPCEPGLLNNAACPEAHPSDACLSASGLFVAT